MRPTHIMMRGKCSQNEAIAPFVHRGATCLIAVSVSWTCGEVAERERAGKIIKHKEGIVARYAHCIAVCYVTALPNFLPLVARGWSFWSVALSMATSGRSARGCHSTLTSSFTRRI